MEKYVVEVKCGDVFVNNKFVSQTCSGPYSIGLALALYIEREYDKKGKELRKEETNE